MHASLNWLCCYYLHRLKPVVLVSMFSMAKIPARMKHLHLLQHGSKHALDVFFLRYVQCRRGKWRGGAREREGGGGGGQGRKSGRKGGGGGWAGWRF